MAMLLGATVAVAIGMSIPSGTDGRVVTSVTDAQRLENSSTAVREIGATQPVEMPGNPATWTRAQQEAYVAWFDTIQASTASVREHGAGTPFHEAGRAHEVVLGSQATGTTHATGSREPRGVCRLARRSRSAAR